MKANSVISIFPKGKGSKVAKPAKVAKAKKSMPFFIKEDELDNSTWCEEINDVDSQIATVDANDVEPIEFGEYAPTETKDQKYYDKVDLAALRIKGHEMAKIKAAYVVYLGHGEKMSFEEFADLFLSGHRF